MKKKLTFYAVVLLKDIENENNPNKNPSFLTLTCTKNQAFEFIMKMWKLIKLDHFKNWCSLRELDVNSDKVWMKYASACLTEEEINKYVVQKVTYSIDDIASILRMFGGCMPLGCSYDTESEYGYLKYKLETQEIAKKFTDVLNEVTQKLDKQGDDTHVDQ